MASESAVQGWHALSVDQAVKKLESAFEGLRAAEARERLDRFGPNKIEEEKPISGWAILFKQLRGFFNIVLYVACAIALFTAQWTDASFITVILVVNTILSFVQEYKASRMMASLKSYVVEEVTVLRDGKPVNLGVTDVVPGDVVLLEEGMRVPADARVIEEHALAVDESMLTGESVPAEKELPETATDADLGDRTDMVFAGTTVVRGTGKAVVCATGMKTELGNVAQALKDAKTPPTAFEIEVDHLSKQITMVIIAMVAAVATLLLFRHSMGVAEIAIFSLSLGVGAIPESLPVVLSFALTAGAQQMAHRRALARRLSVVESLGSVDTICTDKTGTLTKNEMTVQAIYVPGFSPYSVSGEGYDPGQGGIAFRDTEKNERLDLLLAAAAVCNNAKKTDDPDNGGYLGDPTEIALLVMAEKDGLDLREVNERCPRLNEIPFTSDRKMMTTGNRYKDKLISLSKGAPDYILEKCTNIWLDGESRPMTPDQRGKIQETLEHFENQALRVLAIAEHTLPGDTDPKQLEAAGAEDNLTFLGLIGMLDPPRAEVRQAIADAGGAGIRTVMITGDHSLTAKAIAARLGMGQNVVTCKQIEQMSDEELDAKVADIDIVARATPLVKVRMLRALQRTKHFASMTGDGVNDSPALKQADVGVAMGLRGTDAAKDAAGLVLLDDNYGTIVAAIEQGRRIFDNIRKFVNYLLTCNVGEVITVFLGALCGLPPLTAIMVLWINLLTDVAPAAALGHGPGQPGHHVAQAPKARREDSQPGLDLDHRDHRPEEGRRKLCRIPHRLLLVFKPRSAIRANHGLYGRGGLCVRADRHYPRLRRHRAVRQSVDRLFATLGRDHAALHHLLPGSQRFLRPGKTRLASLGSDGRAGRLVHDNGHLGVALGRKLGGTRHRTRRQEYPTRSSLGLLILEMRPRGVGRRGNKAGSKLGVSARTGPSLRRSASGGHVKVLSTGAIDQAVSTTTGSAASW